jgi:hypothetical protein
MTTRAGLYEWFAHDCMQAALQTEEPNKREMLLKLAEEWLTDARRSHTEGSSMPPTPQSAASRARP